ncbi:hypothetical protein JOD82_002087 [Paenibacillus sp. 1182]|uniref:DUF4046 domain-containing protein n=1 Tax=Paenibacillus sp. 1182 TaxID=2806565 RepID=UPI001AEA4619|nr:DUF4046 domain-containing protein [Paenibacillus sp. 1182]MBP1309067.1 hypothetical protein [Paenibacillus sp. 1182]
MVEAADILSIYREVLEGKRKTFPRETWSVHNDGPTHFSKCLRYMVLDVNGWGKEEFLEKYKGTLLTKWKLSGGHDTLYQGSTYLSATFCFPEFQIKPWQMTQAPHDFWTEETLKLTLRDLFENELKWGREEIASNITTALFNKYNLLKVLNKHRKLMKDTSDPSSGLYRLMNFVYPEFGYRLHEFQNVKRWDDDDLLESLKWLFETKLNWTQDEIEDKLNLDVIYQEGFENILWKRFNKNISRMVSFVYPDRDWGSLKKKYYTKTLTSDQLDSLNEDILSGLTYPVIAKKYRVSLDMVKYYSKQLRTRGKSVI